MTIQIALLRAINLAGRNQVAMSDLRDLLRDLGFSGVRSLLQSGNLVFESGRRTAPALERLLETETRSRLGLSTDFVIRTADEWKTLVERNPFPDEAERDPGRLVVVFLKEAPDAESVTALQAAIKGPELVRAEGKQLYIVYPNGIGRSKLTTARIEQKVGTRGTGRNWNTVLKLAALTRA